MRLDKYLKVSRIIKRRTVANDACSGGRVSLNGRVAKPGAEVQENDVLEIRFGHRVGKYRLLSVKETVRKEGAADLYEVLEEERADQSGARGGMKTCAIVLAAAAAARAWARRSTRCSCPCAACRPSCAPSRPSRGFAPGSWSLRGQARWT
jgi:ribosomal 50S subunit-recycling heat shock protein